MLGPSVFKDSFNKNAFGVAIGTRVSCGDSPSLSLCSLVIVVVVVKSLGFNLFSVLPLISQPRMA